MAVQKRSVKDRKPVDQFHYSSNNIPMFWFGDQLKFTDTPNNGGKFRDALFIVSGLEWFTQEEYFTEKIKLGGKNLGIDDYEMEAKGFWKYHIRCQTYKNFNLYFYEEDLCTFLDGGNMSFVKRFDLPGRPVYDNNYDFNIHVDILAIPSKDSKHISYKISVNFSDKL